MKKKKNFDMDDVEISDNIDLNNLRRDELHELSFEALSMVACRAKVVVETLYDAIVRNQLINEHGWTMTEEDDWRYVYTKSFGKYRVKCEVDSRGDLVAMKDLEVFCYQAKYSAFVLVDGKEIKLDPSLHAVDGVVDIKNWLPDMRIDDNFGEDAADLADYIDSHAEYICDVRIPIALGEM